MPRPVTAEDLLRFVFVGDPRLSPDGRHVLYGRKTITEKNAYLSHLHLVDVETGEDRQLTRGEKSCASGRFRADGGAIFFLSARKDEKHQIHVLPLDGGEAEALTDLPEGAFGAFLPSPDGTKIAFTFRDTVAEHTKAWKKENEHASKQPWIADEAWHRLDGDGYFGNARHTLRLLDIATREVTLLSDKDALGEYDFDWLPDSSGLIVTRHRSKEPLRDVPDVGLFRIALDGTETELPGLPKGTKEAPRVSPDGRWIAYAGDVDETDPWGTRNTKIYLVPIGGGEPRDLTGHEDIDMAVATLSDTGDAAFGAHLEWKEDGSGLYVQIGVRGETQLGVVSVDGGTTLLTDGKHALSIGTGAKGRIAALRADASTLAEVGVLESQLATGRCVFRQLTNHNGEVLAELNLPQPESFVTPAEDGAQVHGWLLRPEGEAKGTLIMVHGGPHCQYGWSFFHEFRVMVGLGYAVVYGNPRGSKGYGEAWCAAIKGDWGNRDWADVQALTRYAKGLGLGKLAIAGGSYGGYMTNWAIGHDRDSYACAISDRCVSNMVSMALNSDFPFNRDGYFKGVAWGDLEAIRELWRQSPISHFDGVKTPTLVIHSEGDLRCNVEQGEEVFLALRQQGVPARMVRYPASTSHGMSRSGPPDLRLHRLGEMAAWFGRWL